jgi:hypothetical protein
MLAAAGRSMRAVLMYEARGATGGVGRRDRVAIGVAGALLVAVAAINLVPNATLPVPTARPAAPTQVAEARAQPTLTPVVAVSEPDDLQVGRNSVLIDGVRFSVDVAPGWESFGPEHGNYITKDERGSQGAEGVIYWAKYPAGALAEACFYLWSRRDAHTADELAGAVSSVPGTDLISGPTDVRLGGRPAKHVEFTVRDDVGCDPGFFFTYAYVYGGPLWPETYPGDSVRVWIVDVDGILFWIQGTTHDQASERLVREMEQTIDSFRFD